MVPINVIAIGQHAARRPGAPESKDIQRHQSGHSHYHHVDRMGAAVDQKVDMFGTVVNRVKPPQEADFVDLADGPE